MTAGTARPITSSVSVDANLHTTYSSIYEVITTDVNDGPETVINASGIPSYGSAYAFGNDSFPWAFCRAITAKVREVETTRKLWTVTVEHSTQARSQQDENRNRSPLDWRPIISGSFVKFSKPAAKDKDGNPVTNSVQEPFVPAVEIDDSRDTLHIEINTATINLATRSQYRNRVNSGVIWGLPARAVKLNQWAWSVKYYGLTPYINNQFEFEINYELWDFQILDAGFRKLANAGAGVLDKKYQTICDNWNQPIHQPKPLDGAGNVLDLGTTPAGVYLTKKLYAEADFTALPVPNPLPGPFV